MPDLPERAGLWKRYALGALIVVVACAAATGVALIHQVDRIAAAFHGDLDTGGELAHVEPGKPQTILLIGSDKRAKGAVDAGSPSRSDTMILMRLDADRDAIALMSLPRDLKVRIPGHGKDRLNTAYAIGGTKLLLKTIKQVTGLRINHVINVDFRGFRDAVNEIGCVYTDVDRRYFNDNSNPAEQYATIDVDPGYQKLCGKDALDYVRYRHTDTDIVRAARQQDFLRQAKSQAGTGKLISKQSKLIKIVSKYTRSDIRGRKQVLTLLKLAIGSIGSPVHEVHFPGNIGASYVTASASEVKKATREFLGVKPSKGPRGESKPKKGKRRSRSRLRLVDLSGQGRDEALQVAKDARGLEIYYPKVGVPGTQYSINSPRTYRICGPNGGKCYSSYRIVLSRDLIGEYYGLQGTTWKDPPILKSPNEVREVGGRKLYIFTDGDRVRLVAWKTKDAVYWVTNTLLQTIPKREMIAIARRAKPLS